ncbi:MAG TPA: Hsp20/alpha crystallin family protein [Bryobacteraceae bacterium]|nr:Hsp20/alpha crystallin family protein [Bryobacteraceae bacterium]
MTLLKYGPFGDVDDMPGIRQMQETLSRFLTEPSSRPWTPAVDILETENELIVKMDAPEVDLKDVDIRLENHTLTVKGERKFEKREDSKAYHRIERSYGTFARTFTLPDTVDTEHVRADYKNGVLSIVLPKKELAKPRSIKVEIGNN